MDRMGKANREDLCSKRKGTRSLLKKGKKGGERKSCWAHKGKEGEYAISFDCSSLLWGIKKEKNDGQPKKKGSSSLKGEALPLERENGSS